MSGFFEKALRLANGAASIAAIWGASAVRLIGSDRDVLAEIDSAVRFAGGRVTFGGEWEDLRFPAQGINPVGLVGPADVETTTGMLLFDPSTPEVAAGVAQLPHAWKEGSEIRPHIHWGAAAAGVGTVAWKLDYTWVVPTGTFTGAYTDSIPITRDALGNGVLETASFGPIDGTGKTISSLFFWKITRVAGSDSFAGDARLVEFDIHYQIDAPGSLGLFTK